MVRDAALQAAPHHEVGARVNGRDNRAFTPVFDGLLPGHDEGAVLRFELVCYRACGASGLYGPACSGCCATAAVAGGL
jgi:hypothetical protein